MRERKREREGERERDRKREGEKEIVRDGLRMACRKDWNCLSFGSEREREKMYLRDLLGFAAGAVGKKVSSS